MKKLTFVLATCLLLAGMAGCGAGTSNSNSNKQVTPGSMAGSWDFTLSSAQFANGSELVALEAILAQDNSGNLSATGPATATGPSGNVFMGFLSGTSDANVTDLGIDFLGAACGGNDDGTRKLTGTINSSNQVSIAFSRGGPQTFTITGTLNASATPPFSGTFKITAPGCGSDGDTGTISGVLASAVTGNYAGTPFNSSNENIAFNLNAGANNSFAGNGTDSVNGPFTLSGTSVGNGVTVTSTDSGGKVTTLVGYYDPQLGAKGSVLANFVVPNASSCPNGAPIPKGGAGCLDGIFAKQ